MDLLLSLINCDTKSRRDFFGATVQTDIDIVLRDNLDLGTACALLFPRWEYLKYCHDRTVMAANVNVYWPEVMEVKNELDRERDRQVSRKENESINHIQTPYTIMPRRLWDLHSNRVVEFNMLQAQLKVAQACVRDSRIPEMPNFWAISHSWAAPDDRVNAETSINNYLWPVPLPRGIELEDVRRELAVIFGRKADPWGHYVWLDVVCMRQECPGQDNTQLRARELAIDVPTIGNIYIAASYVVRYFNGLGRTLRFEGWDDERHWLRRSWTLQEIKPELYTYTGGISTASHFLDWHGCTINGYTTPSLREALLPLQKIARDAASPQGCKFSEVVREMARRVATNPVDKVAGLSYLLRSERLPAYSADMLPEHAWHHCFHSLTHQKKFELLFTFPYRGSETQWWPTWQQLIAWPKDRAVFLQPPPFELIFDFTRNTCGDQYTPQAIGLVAGRNALEQQIQRVPGFVQGGDVFYLDLYKPSMNTLRFYQVMIRSKRTRHPDVAADLYAVSDIFAVSQEYLRHGVPFTSIYTNQPALEAGDYYLITTPLHEGNTWVVSTKIATHDYSRRRTRLVGFPLSRGVHVFKKCGLLRTDAVAKIALSWQNLNEDGYEMKDYAICFV